MNWLARLKKIEIVHEVGATKPTETLFVVSVAPILAPMQKTGGDPAAANDGAPDPDRWCYPYSAAMTGREIDTFTGRLARFTGKGMALDMAESLADKLVIRDRDKDDRRICLECSHLAGYTGSWRCSNWQQAGGAMRSRDAGLAGDLVHLLQRCDGFNQTIQFHYQGSHHGQT
jgi:hypothetical protein